MALRIHALTLMLLTGCAKHASPEQVAEARRLVARAKERQRAAAEGRQQAMARALQLTGSTRRCPIQVPLSPGQERGSTQSAAEALRMAQGLLVRTTRMQVVNEPEALMTQDGPLVRAVGERIRHLERLLARPPPSYAHDPGADLIRQAKELAEQTWNWDLVVFTEQIKLPLKVGSKEFRPGTLRGRAFLYSYEQQRIACVADVAVESSRTVQVSRVTYQGAPIDSRGSDQAALDGDLENEALRAAAGALVAVD